MLIREKTDQAIGILQETGIDCWLTFVRETSELCDPALHYIAGCDMVGQAAFLLGRNGKKIAVVASFDRHDVEALGVYDRVEGYTLGLREALLAALDELAPAHIGINYSVTDFGADGLTHGMYLRLLNLLSGTPYASRLVSAEPVTAALRGRKTPEELRRMRHAIEETLALFELVGQRVASGWTMKGVSDFLHDRMAERGLGSAWSLPGNPAVNSGPDVEAGHGAPPDMPILPGHVLHLDFGVRFKGYSSDLQRVWYVLRPGESAPPADVLRGFETVQRGIREAAKALRPGVSGCDVDAVARRIVTEAGYPEYRHSLGHQVGMLAHDGGTLLGPTWERYGDLVTRPVERGQVYTLEFGVDTSGGYVGQEEMVLVTDTGCEFLSPMQKAIPLLRFQ